MNAYVKMPFPDSPYIYIPNVAHLTRRKAYANSYLPTVTSKCPFANEIYTLQHINIQTSGHVSSKFFTEQISKQSNHWAVHYH